MMTKEQAQSVIDAETARKVEELAQRMTQAELWRLCEGLLRASATSQRVLIERFGMEEWRRFNHAIETGRIKI